MLDQDKNLTLISLSILIIALLDNVWILKGEVICSILLGVNGSMCDSGVISYGESKSWSLLGL